MFQSTTRRTIIGGVFAAAALLLAGGIPPAAADAALNDKVDSSYVSCREDLSDGSILAFNFVFYPLGQPIQPEPVGGFNLLTDDPATTLFDLDSSVGLTEDNGTITASFSLFDGNYEPAGIATIVVTVGAAYGPASLDQEREAEPGNKNGVGRTRSRAQSVLSPVNVTFPSGEVRNLDPSSCYAIQSTTQGISNTPASFAGTLHNIRMACDLHNEAATASLRISGLTVDGGSVRITLFLPDGNTLTSRWSYFRILDEGVHDYLPLRDSTGSYMPEPARLDLDVSSSGEPTAYVLRTGTFTDRVSGTAYPVVGTLSFPGDITFDLGDCVLEDVDIQHFDDPENAHPSTAGPPPANDAPNGAVLLALGQAITQQTKSASDFPEADYECLPFSAAGLPPVTHTVWYKLHGTGHPVTVDTAATDFDTAIAVYTDAGSERFAPTPGGCLDDIQLSPSGQSLQAAVTIDTETGTDYYVQVGGMLGRDNWGTLKMTVD